MSVDLINGPRFNMVAPEMVVDYLKRLDKTIITHNASDLKISAFDSNKLQLHVHQGSEKIYPVRKTFLHKLLKWYGINHFYIKQYDINTLIAICNDHLKAIGNGYSKYAQIKFENGEAVSIVSSNFTYISDLEVINLAEKYGISTISRDDFMLRIYTDKKSEKAPVVDELCGFGFNITNSETGFSALKAEHFILRYSCSNGATSKIKTAASNLVHYNQKKEDLLKEVSAILDNASLVPEDFIQSVPIAIKMKAKNSFPHIQYQINNIIGSSKGYSFFQNFDKNNSTLYDVFNHITHSAKHFEFLERYSLELLATDHLIRNASYF